MHTTLLAKDACPNCGGLLDAATDANGGTRSPSAGDISFCAHCGSIAKWDDELKLIKVDLEEAMSFPQEVKDVIINLIEAFWQSKGLAIKGTDSEPNLKN